MVSTQATAMLPATPQRTADARLVAPTPMIAEVIVWVVDTGAWKANAVVYSTVAAADAVCAIRNRRFTLCGLALRNAHSSPVMARNARANPTSGESTIGMTTLSRMTFQCTVTPDAMPTPVSAPISACDDDDGSANHHVIRFQTIAPMIAESTRIRPRCGDAASLMSMMPLPMVCATAVPSRAPTRLKIAAMISAARGVRALVETDVAIALAASWKPLV